MQAWTEAITYIATVMIEGGNAEEADVQRQQAANEAKFEELNMDLFKRTLQPVAQVLKDAVRA